MYGYEPEDMVGRFGWEFIHPDDLAAMTGDFSARSSGPHTITNTYRVLRGDGDYVHIEAKVRALHDPVSGELVEFHTVARDVSDRRQAEADVRRAIEEAELANAAKSEFLSRMSHELRTPLHAILGFGELLGRGELAAPQHEQLDQITKAGRHLLELINEVLDLSRIEEGELHLSLEPVLVEQVVSEAMGMLAPLAAARSVTLEPPLAKDLAMHVLADRQRLKQVLLNLLSNAVKYNRDGGSVRVTTTRDDDGIARIEVADTGIGIADEDLVRAFAAFERLGAEATEVEGTGLGLALTRRLIEAMGGSIGVDSEVGRGTTFWLDLSVVSAPEVASRASKVARPAPPVPARTDARTVLYIEDNPSNIKLVDTILHGAARDHAARRTAREPRAGARPRARAGARPAGPQPARHLRRGGAAPAARRSAHGADPRRDGERGCRRRGKRRACATSAPTATSPSRLTSSSSSPSSTVPRRPRRRRGRAVRRAGRAARRLDARPAARDVPRRPRRRGARRDLPAGLAGAPRGAGERGCCERRGGCLVRRAWVEGLVQRDRRASPRRAAVGHRDARARGDVPTSQDIADVAQAYEAVRDALRAQLP